MAIKDLVVRFGSDTSGFNRGLKDVKRGISSLSKLTNGISGIAAKSIIKASADIGKGVGRGVMIMANGFADGFTKLENASKEATAKIDSETKELTNRFKKLAPTVKELYESGNPKNIRAAEVYKRELHEIKNQLIDLDNQKAKLENSGSGSFGKNLANAFVGHMKAIPAAAKAAFGGVKTAGKTLLSGAGNIFKKIGSYAKAGLQKVGGAIKSVFSKIASHFKRGSESAGRFTKALNGSLGVLARMAKRKFFTAIWDQAREGLRELAKFSPAFNAAISGLQSSFKYAGNSLMAAFAPIITHVVPYLTVLIDKLAEAMNWIAKFTGALLGQKNVATAVKTQENYAAALGDTASETKEAAKENKKALAGFDEINTLNNDNSNEESGNSGVSTGGGFQFEDVAGASSLADRFKELFNVKDFEGIGKLFADKCNEFIHRVQNLDWDGISKKVNSAVKNFAKAVNGFVDRLDWYAIGDVIGKGLTVGFGAINTFFKEIKWNEIGAGLAKGLNGLLDSLDFGLIGETVSNSLNAVFDLLDGFAKDFDWNKLGKSISDGVNGIFTNLSLSKAVSAVQEWLKGLLDAASSLLANIDFKKLGENILQGFRTIDWGGLFTSLYRFIGTFVGAGINYLKDTVWPVIKGIGSDIADGFKDGVWEGVKSIAKWVYDHMIKPLVDGVKEALGINSPSKVFAELGDWCIKGFANALSGLWNSVKQFFTDAWTNIKAVFSGVGEFFRNVWDGIGSGLKGAVNGVIGFINGMISGVTAGINAVIRALNKLQIAIPDWVPGFGGSTFGFNIAEVQAPQIPLLADGGIAYDNAFVNVAEYAGSRSNPEVIAPLDKLAGILKGIMGTGGAQTVNVTCVLEDGTIVGRTTQTIRRNNRRGLEGVA